MFNLAAYNTAPPELQARARQLGSLVARVSPGTVGLSGFRKQLDTFFGSYIAELQDRGFPVWHPLPFQVPDDREGAFHADEFMLGDEMLIAPFYEPGDQRSVYLPRGIWTNLETNEVTPGPRTITVETQVAAGVRAQRRDRAAGCRGRHGAALLPQGGRRVLPAGGRYRRILAGPRVSGAGLHAAGNRIEEGSRLPVGGPPRGEAVERGVRGSQVQGGGGAQRRWPTAPGSTMRRRRTCTSG